MRGNESGAQRHRTENQDSDRDYNRVGGFHVIELRFHQPAESPDKGQPDADSRNDHRQGIAKHEPNRRPALGAKRQPDPDLARTLRHYIRHYAVQAHQRK